MCDNNLLFATVPLFFDNALGCGFHIGGGYIVTAAHNMLDTSEQPLSSWVAYVQKNKIETTAVSCSFVGVDAVCDVGVLRMINPSAALNSISCLEFASNREMNSGDDIKICGYPLGVDINSVSKGVVRDPQFSTASSGKPVELMLVDAPARPGNSGSPIVNADGKVVGIFTHSYGQYTNVVGITGSAIVGRFFNASESLGGGCASYIMQESVFKIIAAQASFKDKGWFDESCFLRDITVSEAQSIFPGGFVGSIAYGQGCSLSGSLIEGARFPGESKYTCLGWSPGCICLGSFTWFLTPGTEVELLVRTSTGRNSIKVKIQNFPSALDTVWGSYVSSKDEELMLRPLRPLPNRSKNG